MWWSEEDAIKLINGQITLVCRRVKDDGIMKDYDEVLASELKERKPKIYSVVRAHYEFDDHYPRYTLYQVGRTYAARERLRNRAAFWWKRYSDGSLRVRRGIEWRPTDTPDGYDYDSPTRLDLRAALKAQGYREARVRITRLRQDDIRRIHTYDLEATGFASYYDLLRAWVKEHDPHNPLNKADEFLEAMDVYKLVQAGDNSVYRTWLINLELVTDENAQHYPRPKERSVIGTDNYWD